MAFDIDDPVTEALVLRFAAMKSLSVEDAILLAVESELARERGSRADNQFSGPEPSVAPARPGPDPAAS